MNGSIPATPERSRGEGHLSKRIISGVRLYRERGDEFVFYVDGSIGVPSRSRSDVIHCVDLEAGTCPCEDHTLAGNECAHLAAATYADAKRRAAWRRKAERRAAELKRSRRNTGEDDAHRLPPHMMAGVFERLDEASAFRSEVG